MVIFSPGKTLVAALLALLAAATARAQTPPVPDLPPNLPNQRFFEDRFVQQRPALTFNGFSCSRASTCGHGWGVGESLLELLASRPDERFQEFYRDLFDWATRSVEPVPASRERILDNTRILQSKGAVALLMIVAEGAGLSDALQRRYPSSFQSASEALGNFLSSLEPRDAFRIDKGKTDDGVKWTSVVANLSRSLDLYLSIENALAHYDPGDFQPRLPPLPDCNGKARLLELVSDETELLDDLGNIPVLLGIRREHVQPGNWPMKLRVAVAYASLTMQRATAASCEPLDEWNYRQWLEKGLASAGAPTDRDRNRHWHYQTAGGQRVFAEGPYYLHHSLIDVVPFWHAVRINGLLGFHPEFDLDDPFRADWFIRPLSWLADTVTPAGEVLPVDDGNRVPMQIADLLEWDPSYGDAELGQKFAWIANHLPPDTPTEPSLLPVLLSVPASKTGEGLAPMSSVGAGTSGIAQPTDEQMLVIRRTSTRTDGSLKNHFLVLVGERGDAILRGEGHEQADQLQLIYYVDDQSVLAESGYDHAAGLGNSTWNHYYDHNVLTVDRPGDESDGGLPPPMPSLFSFRVVSRHASVQDLTLESNGQLDVLSGRVPLSLTLTRGLEYEQDVAYERNVLFVGDDNHPYVIDINRGTSISGPVEYRMNYHVRGNALLGGPQTYSWRSMEPDNPGLETVITAFGPALTSREAVVPDRIMEKYRTLETISRLEIQSRTATDSFTSVAFVEARELAPPSPEAATEVRQENGAVAYVRRQRAGTVDILIVRSQDRPPNPVGLDIDGQRIELQLEGRAGFGFVRLRTDARGAYLPDPEFTYNLSTAEFATLQEGEAGPSGGHLSVHPNPVSAFAEIEYELEKGGFTRLSIVDVQGREVAVIECGFQPTGRHSRRFEASALANGLYFIQLETGEVRRTTSFILRR